MIPRRILQRRIGLTKLIFTMLFIGMALRAMIIQLFPRSANLLQNIADKQYQSTIVLSPYRGSIYDHRHTPLAISLKAPSVAVNPRLFNPTKGQLQTLSQLLQLPADKIKALAHKPKYFAWLKRKINYQTADSIKKLDLKGIHFLLEPARYYPGGQAAAALLGYVGTDNSGLLGLERSYDRLLQGAPSQLISLKDARGQQILMDAQHVSPNTAGRNLILTLDRVIQEITEDALAAGVENSLAKQGFAVVMDPHTGRILAMSNYPSFNPNNPASLSPQNTTNPAISMRFEAGSIIKPFVIAAALEEQETSPYELHHCEKSGRYQLGPSLYIHDDHPKEFCTTEEVLIYSSNICIFKIAQKLGKERIFSYLKRFGFASPRGPLNLPGEAAGSLDPWQSWQPIRFANITFGQGFLTTGLEVAQAYAALANGGHLVKPFILERIESPSGEVLEDFSPNVRQQVLSKQTALLVSHMLAKVVTEGTARKAMSKLYTTAGKTGTAEKYDLESFSYAKDKRIANFAGFAPVDDPHLVIYVVLDEPQKKPYYGGLWAAPVFKDIAERSLKYLNVATDKSLAAN